MHRRHKCQCMTFVVCLSIVLRVRVGFWVGGLGLSLVCGLGLGLVGSGLEWSSGLDGYLDHAGIDCGGLYFSTLGVEYRAAIDN